MLRLLLFIKLVLFVPLKGNRGEKFRRETENLVLGLCLLNGAFTGNNMIFLCGSALYYILFLQYKPCLCQAKNNSNFYDF